MYEDIREQFKTVISFSQGIPDPKVDYLFKEWEKNKARFIERFGGPIYEFPTPVEFTLDETQKRRKAMEFATTISDIFNNPELADFIDQNLDTFYENKVSKNLGKNIPEGMKLLKAFKFFESDKTALRNIQDMASHIIQENKIKGTLCFSVHPLDYLSSSENTYNWRSCHALDGEYRAGNLSYMVDTSTFMVYLKGADNQSLESFGGVLWNSKKWRMLIHANQSDDIIFAGRQYPFSSKNGIDTVLKVYNALMNKGVKTEDSIAYLLGYSNDVYGPWHSDYIDSCNDIPLKCRYMVIDNELVDIERIVVEGKNSLNYNDILSSSCYKYPYYAIFKPWVYHSIENLINNPVIVGEEIPCLHCGEELIGNSETMRCYDCELKYGTEVNDTYSICDCCGGRIYLDDAISVDDGIDMICDSCFREHAFICENCGGVFYNTEKVFHSEKGDSHWYCRDCFEDII